MKKQFKISKTLYNSYGNVFIAYYIHTKIVDNIFSDLGVAETLLFTSEDLYDSKDIMLVVDCLLHLKQLVMNDPESEARKLAARRKHGELKKKVTVVKSRPSLKWFWVPKLSWVSLIALLTI